MAKPKSLDFLVTYVDDSVEEWKPSPKYNGVWLSNQGRVRNGLTFEDSIIVEPMNIDKAIFCVRRIDEDGNLTKKFDYYVAPDIAKLFIPNPNPNRCKRVMFRDGNPKNCRVSNMTWSTPGYHSMVPKEFRTDNLSRYSMAKVKNATFDKLDAKRKLEEQQRIMELFKEYSK